MWQVAGARCRHLAPEFLRSLGQSSRKLWPKPNSGNSVPCILPCKIGGSWNLMKERYLSKTPNLTFVYLSKCNIKLPCIFGNSKKKKFLNRSNAHRLAHCTLSSSAVAFSITTQSYELFHWLMLMLIFFNLKTFLTIKAGLRSDRRIHIWMKIPKWH